MKRIGLTILVLAALAINGGAQEFTDDFGSALPAEVQMKQWPKDSIAEAAVIYDLGLTRFMPNEENDDLDVFFKRTTKIKILTQAGMDYAKIEIPFYHNSEKSEKVTAIQANVYNDEDGTVRQTRFNVSQVYQEELNGNWQVKKFALPNVKPGSVIEYTYIVVSPFKFNLPAWEFQWRIPVRKSNYIVGIVPFYEYTFVFQGASNFDYRDSYPGDGYEEFGPVKYKEVYHEFEFRNVPAFRNAEFITSTNDYIRKINFQLVKFTDITGKSRDVMQSWEELTSGFMKDNGFGKYMNDARKYAQTLPVGNAADTLGNIRQIVGYVKSSLTWNNTFAVETDLSLKELLIRKNGNSANLNLFLAGVLQAKGIHADPVLISTRGHGKVRGNYPHVNAFNNVVVLVRVNNRALLLDATDPFCAFDALPDECLNEKGFILADGLADKWLSFGEIKGSEISENMEMALNLVDNTIESTIYTTAGKMDAALLRRKVANNPEEFKKEHFNDLTVLSFATENLNVPDSAFKIKTTVTADLEMAANHIILHPFLGLTPRANIFKAESRDYPIDLTYARTRRYGSRIQLPQGYRVNAIPESFTIDDPLMALNYRVSVGQSGDHIVLSLSYTFKNAVYAAGDYQKLKSLFAQVVAKLNAPLILAPVKPSAPVGASRSGNVRVNIIQ